MNFLKNDEKIQLSFKKHLNILNLLKKKFALVITLAILISFFSSIEVPIVYASTSSRPVPKITSQPTGKTINVDDTAKLKIRAEGTGALSYQWYSNTTDSTKGATELRGETSSTYTAPTNTSGTKYYYCIVTNKVGTKIYTTTSDVAKIVVYGSTTTTKEPRITSQPSSITSLLNDTAKLKIEATANGSLSYKWYSNTKNGTNGGTKISAATSSTYSAPTNTTGTKYYYCIVTNKIGSNTYTTTSNVVKVAVTKSTTATPKAATITTQPTSKTVRQYDSGKLNVEAEGTGTLSYQWYSNTINNTRGSTKISGATSSTYSAPTDTIGKKYYYCIVTNTNGSKTYTTTSNVVKVVVEEESSSTKLPKITTQPTSRTVYVGDSAKLRIEAEATGTLSYKWYSNTTDSTNGGTKISNATNSSYWPPTSTIGSKYYYCIVTSTIGTKTYTTTSDVVEVLVKKSSSTNTTKNTKTPTITTQPTDQTVYVDDFAKLKIKATGTGTLSYRWYVNTSSSTSGGIKIGGATSSTYLPSTSTAETKYYYCIVTNTIGSKTYTTTSDVVKVTVKR